MEFQSPLQSANESRQIWSTLTVNKLMEAMDQGYAIRDTPFFERDFNYRKANIVFEYTDFELDEIRKCAKDIVHFANTYCQVMTDEGYRKIELRDYQVKMLRNMQKHRQVICLASRQIGKTICSSIFLVWYLLFHFDRNVLLVSNKGETTKEIMSKICAILEGLPFFLKPGVIKKDVMKMFFDNGCKIMGQNTTKKSAIGFTIHLLFLDEFAHIQENIKKSLYENIYPVISSSKISRIIITSTPNKFDLFHDIYVAAEDGQNQYFPIRVDWWEVPGRDEDWKKRMIADLGSEAAFNEQYGNQFMTDDALLLGSDEMKRLKLWVREYEYRDFDELDQLDIDYTQLKWNPDFDEEELRNEKNRFVFTLDMSDGVGRDFCVINIFQLMPLTKEEVDFIESPGSIDEFFGLKQIGVYRHNLIQLEDFAKIIYVLLTRIFIQEQVRIVMEYNVYGSELLKNLMSVFPSSNDFDEETLVRYVHRIGGSKKVGIRMNHDLKKLYCEKLRRHISKNRIKISEPKTITEFNFFSRTKSGSFEAQTGTDDLVMSCVSASSFFDTDEYSDLVEEAFDFLDPGYQDELEEIIDRFSESDDPDYEDFGI